MGSDYMANVRFPQYQKRRKQITVQEISRRTAKEAMDVYLAISITILADCFGFGKKRIERFKDRYQELGESLGTGMDDLETIKKNIKKIYGVEV